MRYDTDRLVFSPSDLVVFLDSEFSAWMDRWYIEGRRANGRVANEKEPPLGVTVGRLACLPDENDSQGKLVASMGMEHEAAFLRQLLDQGCQVEDIKDVAADGQIEATIVAMRQGAEFIYQGRLKEGRFEGFADFLVRVLGESKFGEHRYEVLDTKLARTVKPYFIVQLCSYSEMLKSIQGIMPTEFSVVLGNNQKQQLAVRKFIYYFRSLRRTFLGFHDTFSADRFPHPGLSTSHGRWSTFATQFLEATDHLSQIATITRNQIKRLESAGIATMNSLANTSETFVPGLAQPVLERLKVQARLQVKSKVSETPLYEIQQSDPANPRRGLALLPPASPSDVFFDIEGFPLVADGLEYLLGAICFEHGDTRFIDWWAHNQQQERRAFQEFVDWLHGRWKSDPSMHVYHYAAYEVSAMRRLMGKHATREDKVDDLLRNHVFVDLYTVVRQGLIVGTDGYSLKDIESLYMKHRGGEVTTAGDSVVAYHAWIESGQSEDWRASSLLKEIRDYNKIDCESTCLLAEWLRKVQVQQRKKFIPPPPPKERGDNEADSSSARLAEALRQDIYDGQVANPETKRVQELLSQLLEFHWREAKPIFWRMFARHEMTELELFDDFDCLSGLERTTTPPRQVKKSKSYEYKFDPDQNTKLHEESTCFFAHDLSVTATIEKLSMEEGLIEIRLGPTRDKPPKRLSLIPNEYVSADSIAEAVYRYVEAWSQGTILSQAVHQLLHRLPPTLHGHNGGPIIPANSNLLTATVDVVRRMKSTVLCIQGPPGTGKTYTAAEAILRLLQDGRRIGVTANSHKVILNILRAVHEAMQRARVVFRLVKVGSSEDDSLIASGIIENVESGDAAGTLGTGPVLMGGTAWLFSRPDLQGEFDYLFVDEAGQFSLANTVAVGLSARNLVLVGDQMQLAQPLLGSHPGDSGESALNYLLDGRATIPPEMGVLLDQTWRMHPDICGFISAAFYEGRLRSHPQTASQRIESNGTLLTKNAGILILPVTHEGNSQASEEEAEVIGHIVAELLQARVHDAGEVQPRTITTDDILVVAPFNMQVRLLKRRLGGQIKVGSIDKFQGQEAHVVIISMCSSTLEDSPRGAEFLLEPNRLNVAVSRAKSLAIVVANPELISARCRTIKEMELANLFCWLVDYSRGEA
eukprot:TRINITY_DN567_c0_g2_i11.p1 TRINITY_DN567_c0_g2~~TRINITY_DN567_c0_g2_i11.p1  ORF type:complete len:1150 (+),score=174.60 TRINITY_DN567_c0_g2_i11:25069-28518(+)